MREHQYRIEVSELNAETLYDDLIKVRGEKGELLGEVDDDRKAEILAEVKGKCVVKCVMIDVSFGQSIVLNSPVIIPQNVPVWINDLVKQANKKIAKLMGLKSKIEPPSSSLIILPDGSNSKN